MYMMNDWKNKHLTITMLGIVGILVLLLSVIPVFAQQDADDDGEDDPSYVYWNIRLDEDSKLSTDLSFNVDKTQTIDIPAMKDELIAGLQQALQCRLDKSDFKSYKNSFHLSARCGLSVQKQELVSRGAIKLNFLWTPLQKIAQSGMTVNLVIPKLGYARGPEGSKEPAFYRPQNMYNVTVEKGQTVVKDITFEFGYRTIDVIWLVAPMLVILLLPIFLILPIRKKALKMVDKDSTAAWFGYWRVQRWIMEGIWLVWFITLASIHADTFVQYITGVRHPALYTLFLLIPPGIISFFCQYLSRPIWLKTRGIVWGRREMLIRGFLEHAVAILPFCFMFIGISSFSSPSGNAMLWFAGAAITLIVGAYLHGKASGTMPRALHSGELKEKVMEMATRAGVKIQQVLLMPAKNLQMGNAFAIKGNKVMITDYLLERLTKSEADCVMAHEIGHLKKRHTLLLSWGGFIFLNIALYVGLRFLLNFAPFLSPMNPQHIVSVTGWIEEYLIYPVSLLFAFGLRYLISRRCERSADEFATLLTGDAEAMITGLVKLSKMNLMPLQWGPWDERLATHPSTMRRLDAIATRHRIPGERLMKLLEAQPSEGTGESYPIPDEATNPGLVFSPEVRSRNSVMIFLLTMMTLSAVPLLLGALIEMTALPSVVYLTGLVLMPLVYLFVSNFTSLLGYRQLKKQLREKLDQAGHFRAYFVGISIEEHPRVYDGNTVWDVGFFMINEKALAYWGDKICFTIPRDLIISVSDGPSFPSWFGIPETYIRWRDGAGERVFHLHSLRGASMISIARQSKLVAKVLKGWWQGKRSAVNESPVLPELALPEFPDVKGMMPGQAVSARNLLTILAFVSCLIFGFSTLFHLKSTVSWYSLALAAWTLIISTFPVFRYRDGEIKQVKP